MGEVTVTIKELIDELSKLDPSAMVVVDGYEGGYDCVSNVVTLLVYDNSPQPDYWGEYENNGEGVAIASVWLGKA
jgi:hypothetical protein